MSLEQQISKGIMEAMKAKDAVRLQKALEQERICVSAGRIGFQVDLDPRELIRAVGADTAEIATGHV